MKQTKNQTHTYIRIGKDIKAGKIPGLVLLCGKEEYLVNFYAEALIDKYVKKAAEALDLITLYRDHVTTKEIIENLETMPLMSQRKVVYLPNFFDCNGKLPKPFLDEPSEMDKLIEYISEISKMDGVLLLITFAKQEDYQSEVIIRNSKLLKAITSASKLGATTKSDDTKEPAAAIYDFDALNNNQLYGFIEKRLHTYGKQFRQGIVSLIVREVGYGNKNIDYGLYNLDNDIRKIIAHCGDAEEITPADVSSVITLNPENNIFLMVDAMGRNRKDEAFKLLHNLLYDGKNEFEILGMTTKQLELMLTTSEMRDAGMGFNQITEILKKDRISEYSVKKAMEIGNKLGSDGLRRILSAAYEVEVNIKSGLMPGPLALEYFIAEI